MGVIGSVGVSGPRPRSDAALLWPLTQWTPGRLTLSPGPMSPGRNASPTLRLRIGSFVCESHLFCTHNAQSSLHTHTRLAGKRPQQMQCYWCRPRSMWFYSLTSRTTLPCPPTDMQRRARRHVFVATRHKNACLSFVLPRDEFSAFDCQQLPIAASTAIAAAQMARVFHAQPAILIFRL